MENFSGEKLPFSKQIAYACGMLGWSILTNIIGVMLVYFYLPPSTSGLVNLLSQTLIFGVLNLAAAITGAGRLFDAFYDPFIGQLSDRSKNPKGRRIPFMKFAIVPAMIFCSLVYLPMTNHESISNALWLTIVLILFFVSATTYIIPYNAMLPEMAHTSEEKVRLSTFQQAGFVFGIIISSAINNIAGVFQHIFSFEERISAVQFSIVGLSILGGIFMAVPVFAIDEKKYCKGKPSQLSILPAMKQTFRNKNFIYYITADFSWYMALYIIVSGLLYFLTVLCGGKEEEGFYLMATMVLCSLLFYPFITIFANKTGKKKIVLFSFALMSGVFLLVYYLGKLPLPPKTQMYMLAIFASLPLATLGILPPAILAEIAEEDAKTSGENREGLYFAVKYFFVKLGQTFGMGLFAFLTLYGKDPGNDFGLRLNGICGFVLCVIAFVVFSNFREDKNVSGRVENK
ncbi:MAG: MFS transporter [Bacteroidetes bacterium]|nr:MFS transporter [Bacteroidota bacterium]